MTILYNEKTCISRVNCEFYKQLKGSQIYWITFNKKCRFITHSLLVFFRENKKAPNLVLSYTIYCVVVVPRRVEPCWFRLSDEPAEHVFASLLVFLAKTLKQEPRCNNRYYREPCLWFLSQKFGQICCVSSHMNCKVKIWNKTCCCFLSTLLWKQKTPTRMGESFYVGSPKESRTPHFAVKGRCLNRLTMGPYMW